MTLENSIKDVIAKKLEDGTIEKLVSEQLQKGVKNALDNLFSSYGDVTKVIEKQVKSVMIPYLEQYNYSEYIVKLDSVLADVLKNSTTANTAMLKNFKELMLPEDRKTITASELFEIWCKFVAKEVNTSGLEVCDDDCEPTYEPVEVSLDVDYNDERSWSSFQHAVLNLECEQDEEMNVAINLSRWKEDKKDHWDISYDCSKDLKSLRRLNEFEIFLLRLSQAGTDLIMDTDRKCDEIAPEKEPEARYE